MVCRILAMQCFVLLLFLGTITHGRLLFEDLESSQSRARYGQQLDNQHIVMIGDSLMRYQYIALAYLLHAKSMLEPGAEPNIISESSHETKLGFHKFVNKQLAPNEYCDCFRTENNEATKEYENRYYFDPVHNTSLSFFLYSGDSSPIQGHWQPGDAQSNHQFRAPDNGSVPIIWKFEHVDDLITKFTSKLSPRPTTLILNAGHWPHLYHDEVHRHHVLGAAMNVFPRVIWKTTSGRNVTYTGSDVDPIICAMDRVECLDLSWTLKLRANNYEDTIHYKAQVYNDISIQLIKQLASRQVVHYAPLPQSLRSSVVSVQHESEKLHYMVDPQGQLRRFTMPAATSTKKQVPCINELRKRPVVQRSLLAAKKCVAGEAISNICAYFQNEVREGDLIRIGSNKTVYLIDSGLRREITSHTAFVSRGFDFDDVKVVNGFDVEAYPAGEPLG